MLASNANQELKYQVLAELRGIVERDIGEIHHLTVSLRTAALHTLEHAAAAEIPDDAVEELRIGVMSLRSDLSDLRQCLDEASTSVEDIRGSLS